MEIKRLITEYGAGGEVEDSRMLHSFMDCEPADRISQLRLELGGIVQGRFPDETLDAIVGKKRKLRHQTYQEWARMCLLWMASYKP